jgi:hypothetical protein
MARTNSLLNLIEQIVEAETSTTKAFHYVSEEEESGARKKFSRTFHFPWSQGATDDDKTHSITDIEQMFTGREVVISEKLDGENTTIYSDGFCHARSLDSAHHASRTYAKAKAAEIGCDLPKGWRLVGENVYAKHSIAYSELPDYFILFGIVDDKNNARPWTEVEEWSELLGIPHVPVIYKGIWDQDKVMKLYPFKSKVGGDTAEGYVVRIADGFPMSQYAQNTAKFVRKNHVQTDQHWSLAPVVPNKKV